MLASSWVLFEGVGEVVESTLWGHGLRDWTDDRCFNRACELLPKLQTQKPLRDKVLRALSASDVRVLSSSLPSYEHWRLWQHFRDGALYLDIETTGLGHSSEITVIGTYYRGIYRGFVNGVNMDEAWDYLNSASLIITFNGKQFDVPFIERSFGKMMSVPHIDLRFVAGSLGYKGGLKKIEPEFGINRSGAVKAVNGYEAVLLWKRYKNGDKNALQTLIDYNRADVEGLPAIMGGCWNRKLETRLNVAEHLCK